MGGFFLYLKKLELKGFKSFAQRTEIWFDRGITAIVGPNGTGKTNIADAVAWALGEHNSRNLRASSANELIYSGKEGIPLNYAEVRLILDNEDAFLPLEFSEVELIRRVDQTGESECFINKSRCRLRDIQELLLTTGVGRRAYSLLSQNQLEAVLSLKPEARRELIEEAAGTSKYRFRRQQALNKLERTERNLSRLKDVLAEVEKQLEPLIEEANKAQIYKKLSSRLSELESWHLQGEKQLLLEQLGELQGKREILEEHLAELGHKQASAHKVREKLGSGQGELEQGMEELRQQIEKLSSENQLHRTEAMLEENNRRSHLRRIEELSKEIEQLHANLREQEERYSAIQVRWEQDRKQKAFFEEAIQDKERRLSYLEEKLASLGKVELTLLRAQANSHRERVKKQLAQCRQAFRLLTAQMTECGEWLQNCQKHIQELKGPRASPAKRMEWMKRIINSLREKIAAGKNRGAQLAFALQELERIIDQKETLLVRMDKTRKQKEELQRVRDELAEELATLKVKVSALEERITSQTDNLKAMEKQISLLHQSSEEKQSQLEQCRQMVASCQAKAARHQTQLREREGRLSELESQLRERGTQQSAVSQQDFELREEIQKAVSEREEALAELHQLEVKCARTESKLEMVVERLEREFRMAPEQIEEVRPSRSRIEVAKEISRLQQELEALGEVNLGAIQHYERLSQRKVFLQEQILDLEEGKESLERVIKEIDQRTRAQFIDAFQRVGQEFDSIFRRLFDGGGTNLTLTDPANILETGVEIKVRLPGRDFQNLLTLSGGERALTAIAFVFALLAVKPSPFCILDEVDAALDDINTQKFTEMLIDWSRESQFLIITHNKLTMEAADYLYGVTMEDSISRLFSYRLSDLRNEEIQTPPAEPSPLRGSQLH